MDEITLQTPIARPGADPIRAVTLRRPTVGDLRGLKLTDVLQMDVRALERLLPRITTPPLLPDDVADLDPADFLTLGGSVVGFFVSPHQRAEMERDRPH